MSGRINAQKANRRNGGQHAWPRKMLTKLLRDENAIFRPRDTHAFLQGMDLFDSKPELLLLLTDSRNCGEARLREFLSMIDGPESADSIIAPLLSNIMTDETSRPLHKARRKMAVIMIYKVPGLIQFLAGDWAECISASSNETVSIICQFLIEASLSLVEARCSEDVGTIAKSMKKSTQKIDTKLSHKLCAILQIVDTPDLMIAPKTKTRDDTAVCWGTDLEPPGGRHDNDHPNFRDISLVPTKAELAYTGRSWLPLASGENRCVQDLDQCLLDMNFRLLREDAVGAMRENITDPRPSQVWKNARIIGASCKDVRNPKGTAPLHFLVQVDPYPGKSMNWQRQRAFPVDGLVAFYDGQQHIMATIHVRMPDQPGEWLLHAGGPIIGVVFHQDDDVRNAIRDISANKDVNERFQEILNDALEKRDIEKIAQLKSSFKTYSLIEVSESFFSYRPVLESLQNMISVPLSRELVHVERHHERPLYLPRIVKLPSDFNGVEVDLDAWSNESMMQSTTLDESQSIALGMSLTSRVSLVQGPPGTGKTFIGSLIAQIIRDNSDESILCVCYTNHALDQFLEHMLKRGEKRLVRIGGRTKSEALKKFGLKALAKKERSLSVSDADKRMRAVVAQMHRCKDEISNLLQTLQLPLEWEHARDVLEATNSNLLINFKISQHDGFAVVGRNNTNINEDSLFSAWKRGENCPEWLQESLSWEVEETENLWLLLPAQRLELMNEWKELQFEEVNGMILDVRQRYEELSAEKVDIGLEIDSYILQKARIIGATTTGAAKYRDLLSLKSASVVIVEEAGEVLEPHVLTSLTENKNNSEETKHLILIGDHLQLRPKLESYSLTKVSGNGFDFDISLFERLIHSGYHAAMLGVQHRMRPCIADIIRRQTYPALKDHPSVSSYSDVRGVPDNLLFIDHSNFENGDDLATTKSNHFEAQLCVEIVRYLLLQGYAHSQVTILTPYVGQILAIVKEMRRSMNDVNTFVSELDQAELLREDADLEDMDSQAEQTGKKQIRVSSVDNYQGEECDIIVISLVRSNKHNGIGFLKEEQRVNVLLSRAKHGMFIVGNAATLRSSSKGNHVWKPLLDMFQSQGRIVKSFPTICQLHPTDGTTYCRTIQEFRTQRPNGGCNRPCNARLKCGHACPLMCHPTDQGHLITHKQCTEPCRRFPPRCPRNHPCNKLCKEDCGQCLVRVEDTILPCGHIVFSPTCDSVRDDSSKQRLSERCQEKVTHTFTVCGHKCETTCANANSQHPICPELCNVMLECGHPCHNKCKSCKDGKHSCRQKCERTLFCGHICGRECHGAGPCQPCDKKCSVSCVHSKCVGKCSYICSSCVEDCDWQCIHEGECSLVCGAPCDRLPCNLRCDKLLACGHRCPGICGEDCPDVSLCIECCSVEIKTNIVDIFEFNTYEEQDLDSDPIIFLECGHFYSKTTMDGVMEIDKSYDIGEEGNFIGLKDLSSSLGTSKPKSCPDCRSPINCVKRYGRLISFMRLRFLERKHMASVETRLRRYSLILRGELDVGKVKRLIETLEGLEKDVKHGPMRKVFEACRGREIIITPPPSRPYLELMRLQAQCFTRLVLESDDVNFNVAINLYQQSIEYADADRSRYMSSVLRLDLCKLLMNWNALHHVKSKVDFICNRVIEDNINAAVVQEAIDLKEKCSNKELKEVLKAMNQVSGYDYGGGWNSHWYECPNGHPYFIGECGGAMELGRCNECGEQIGGGSHRLLASNRSSTAVAEALRE